MALVRIRTEIFVNGQWVDISLHVLNRQSLAISWGRKDYSSRVTHTKCSPQINNKGGLYSNRNPYSDYFGQLTQNTPVRQSVQLPDGTWAFLQHGEIASWPKRWDLSGNDAYMPVQTAGILRRLGQGKKPLKDSLRRHIDAHGPRAYWPLTDGQEAREGSEVAAGGQPMRAVGESGSFFQGQPNWGKGSLAGWFDPVVELPDETIGRLTARVPTHTVTGWSIDHVMASSSAGNTSALEILDNGPRSDSEPQAEWRISTDAFFDEVQLRITERGETTSSTALLTTISGPGIFDGGVHHLRVTTADDGASGTDWAVYVDGVLEASGNRATTHRPVSQLTFRWGTVEGGGVETNAIALGHIVYFDQGAPTAVDTWRAVQGHVRELAGRRIERLCAEQGVALQVVGDLDTTPAMGPQKPGTFLDLLETAAAVDGGVVHEARDEFALAYRTNRSRYNQGM